MDHEGILASLLVGCTLSARKSMKPGVPLIDSLNRQITPARHLTELHQTVIQQLIVLPRPLCHVQHGYLLLHPFKKCLHAHRFFGALKASLLDDVHVYGYSLLQTLVDFFIHATDYQSKPIIKRIRVRSCHNRPSPVLCTHAHTSIYIIGLPINGHSHFERPFCILIFLRHFTTVKYYSGRKHTFLGFNVINC